jgi:hypothetical protein
VEAVTSRSHRQKKAGRKRLEIIVLHSQAAARLYFLFAKVNNEMRQNPIEEKSRNPIARMPERLTRWYPRWPRLTSKDTACFILIAFP